MLIAPANPALTATDRNVQQRVGIWISSSVTQRPVKRHGVTRIVLGAVPIMRLYSLHVGVDAVLVLAATEKLTWPSIYLLQQCATRIHFGQTR